MNIRLDGIRSTDFRNCCLRMLRVGWTDDVVKTRGGGIVTRRGFKCQRKIPMGCFQTVELKKQLGCHQPYEAV